MGEYAVVRTDNISATILGKNLVSLRFDAAIENGNVLKIGDLEAGQREVRVGEVPEVDTALGDIALIISEEVPLRQPYGGLSDFINEADAVLKCARLTSKDIFSVTAPAVDGAVGAAVGYTVELQADTNLNIVATPTGGSTVVGKVLALEGDYIVIEVA
jgi:hypothetical protein